MVVAPAEEDIDQVRASRNGCRSALEVSTEPLVRAPTKPVPPHVIQRIVVAPHEDIEPVLPHEATAGLDVREPPKG